MKKKKFAIVEINGSQEKVVEGKEVVTERVGAKEGAALSLERVLLVVENGTVQIGQPLVAKAKVEAKIIKHLKGKKIRVSTYKAKSRHRRVMGFRSQLTRLQITKITTG